MADVLPFELGGNAFGSGQQECLVSRLMHVLNDADGKPQKVEKRSHPHAVATGQILVVGDQVHAAGGQGVEVNGHRGDEGFAFTGRHFGNLALMQHGAAKDLHVVGLHFPRDGFSGAVPLLADHAPTGVSNHGERFGHDFVEEFGLVVANGLVDFFELVVVALAQSRFEVAAQLFFELA